MEVTKQKRDKKSGQGKRERQEKNVGTGGEKRTSQYGHSAVMRIPHPDSSAKTR
jgi:hypothetical protein